LNLLRFDYFIADYLDDLFNKTHDWDLVDKEAERIRIEIYKLINSDLTPENFLERLIYFK